MTDTITRRELAELIVCWTARERLPLVVGNGFLCREVRAQGDYDHILLLDTGMGLAAAVAAGVAEATGSLAVALEGDGNHLMGLGSAASVALRGSDILHVIHWNGGWESAGAQRFLPDRVHLETVASLGYGEVRTATTALEFQAALEAGVRTAPAAINVIGRMGCRSASRSEHTMAEGARRFECWLAGRGR